MPDDHACQYVLLHDVARWLALADQGELHVDGHGRLLPRAIRLLAERSLLFRGAVARTRSQFQAPGLGYAIGLLRCGGLVAAAGKTLHLTLAGRRWLAQPVQAQVGFLRQVWWDNPQLGHRCLPVTRLHDPSLGHWREVVLNLAAWAALLGSEDWTPASEVYGFLAQQGVPVVRDPGTSLPRAQQAIARRTSRVVGLMVHTILPYLGLVCVQGHGRDVQVHTTPEGAAWLHAAIARQRDVSQPEQHMALELALPIAQPAPPLTPQPQVSADKHLCVTVQPAAPASFTFDLAHFSRLLPCRGPAVRYQITRQTLEQGVRWGYSVPAVGFLVARVTDGHLPLKVAEQLLQWQDELALVLCEPGYRLRPPAPAVLEELRRRKPFSRRTQPLASGQEVWVAQEEFGALARYLRRLGYTVVKRQGAPSSVARREKGADPMAEPWPSLPHVLPVPQLLVALGTYQYLRTQVPGLAELRLSGLVDDLAAALGALDATAVERLVASHAALVEQSLAHGDTGTALMTAGEVPGGAEQESLTADGGQAESGISLPSRLESAAAQGT